MAINITPLLDALQAKLASVNTDVYFDNVTLLLNYDNTFTDKSSYNQTITTSGNAAISTTQKKFGPSSGFFPDTPGSDLEYIYTPISSNNSLGSGDFTIETWVYLINKNDNYPRLIQGSESLDNWNSTSSWTLLPHHLDNGDVPSFAAVNLNGNSNVVEATTSLSLNTWYHLAVTREGNTFRIFVNGSLEGSSIFSGSIDSLPILYQIGGIDFTNSENTNGYVDDTRITKGVARYTKSFTPPVLPFPDERGSSDTALTELNALNYLATYASNTNNVIRYPKIPFLNIEGTGDSADSYTGDFGYDISNNKYYFRAGFQWNELTLNDSAAVDQIKYIGENGGFVYGGGNLLSFKDVEYYPFASTTNMALIGDQTTAKGYNSGFADKSNGNSYLAGGYGRTPPATGQRFDAIDKHANASSNFTMSNVGNLTIVTTRNAGVVDVQADEGYLHLGGAGSPAADQTRIDKFAFSSGTPVTISPNVANTNATGGLATGITDYTNNKGYFRGVFAAETDLEFLPFSSGTPVTTTTITSPNPYGPPTSPGSNTNGGVGMSSQTDAYCAIHSVYSGSYSTVEKFPLSSVTPATISTIPGIFDYQTGKAPSAGAVSETGGYMQGATDTPNPSGIIPQSYLTKFPFAADIFTTSFGDAVRTNTGPPVNAGFKTGSHW